jgi:hypothetical protein
MQPFAQVRYLNRMSPGQHFDGPVGVVSHPARHSQQLGFPLDEPPETYTLHASAHNEAPGCELLIQAASFWLLAVSNQLSAGAGDMRN